MDANGNGVSDAGELKDLSALGIIELDLNAHASSDTNNGNLLGLISGYKTADGHTHVMADVWFAKDQSSTSSATATLTTPSSSTDPTLHAASNDAAAGTAGTAGTAAGDPNLHQATAAPGTADPSQQHAAATGTTPTSDHADAPLNVSANDLLAHPGDNLLAGPADTSHATVNATLAVVQVDVPLIQVDHTQLVDDKQNTPLI
mgnify:CR=1 FL=1